MQRARAQRVLRRHAHRTAVGVAGLGLDAAHREHEAARRVRPVGAECERAGDVEGGDELARGADLQPVAQAGAAQRVVREGQALDERHAHVVGEFQRRRAGAALLAVDNDEIRHDAGLQHGPDDAHELAPVADAELEADRLAARQLAQPANERDKLDRRREFGMRGGRDAILAERHAARLADLGRDLGGRQHAAMARLGALGELDLDHLDLGIGGLLAELLGVEAALGGAAAEIARADLPDDVAAALAVVARDAALAGIVGEAAGLGAEIERQDGVGRERAEAHRRNVVDRGVVGQPAIGPADADPEIGVLDMLGHHRMGEPLIARIVDPFAGAEGALVLHPLGALVDQRALVARERLLVLVVLDQILADFRPDALEQEPHMADHRVVAQDRMRRLEEIAQPERGERGEGEKGQRGPGAEKQRDERGEGQHRRRCQADIPVHSVTFLASECRRDRGVELVGQFVELAVLDDEGRRDQHVVALPAVDGTGHWITN